MAIKGSCLCGEVTFEIDGDFENFFICHCSYCRKDTGSAFAANLFTSAGALRWLSGQARVANFNLPSTRHARSFCAACGSALPNVQIEAGFCVVPAGCLDEDIGIGPQAHIFTASQAPWEGELASIKRYSGFPE
ncbi:MAG: GFA family protein [Gammaproteobacteria bacterium]|nr:GFA family protein [Gammaproteobacteria bacterium]